MRRRELLLRSSLLPLIACTESKAEASWRTLIAGLENRIPKLMEEHLVPGLSIAIIKDAQLRWRRGFGFKDSESKQPVDNDTIFEAASMSKPVFAYAVMKLCEKGVLDLDTPLTRYTPERFLEGDPRLDLITARHVLSHTSGFQNWSTDAEPLKINFTPGEKYLYSGEGYSYLQSVVTRLVGQAIDPYMRANLLAPLGMSSSGYVWNGAFEAHAARPHDPKGKPLKNRKRTAEDVIRYAAAGDLHSTPTEYAKFLIEVMDPKPGDAFRLTKGSVAEMLRPQMKLNDEYSSAWALGWRLAPVGKRVVFMHGGDNTGFHAFAAATVEGRSGWVIMTNGENGPAVLSKLAAELLNPYLEA